VIPTNGRAKAACLAQKRYTRHEVTAPRVVGPSGRTTVFDRHHDKVYSPPKGRFLMKSLFDTARTNRSVAFQCRSKRHQMPRRHLRVLPSLTRPSLFAGD
jgi:hypothetical protein